MLTSQIIVRLVYHRRAFIIRYLKIARDLRDAAVAAVFALL